VNGFDKEQPKDDARVFKDSMGRFRTQSLFKEYRIASYPAYYTILPYDVGDTLSLRKIYFELGDPTEYRVATEYLGGWAHWKQLCATKWFNELVTEWREEMEVKLACERLKEMLILTRDTKSSLQATKWLSDKYSPVGLKRGRPSKEEKAGHLKQTTEEDKLYREDAVRIGLVK
jgi:hypothetical protein